MPFHNARLLALLVFIPWLLIAAAAALLN